MFMIVLYNILWPLTHLNTFEPTSVYCVSWFVLGSNTTGLCCTNCGFDIEISLTNFLLSRLSVPFLVAFEMRSFTPPRIVSSDGCSFLSFISRLFATILTSSSLRVRIILPLNSGDCIAARSALINLVKKKVRNSSVFGNEGGNGSSGCEGTVPTLFTITTLNVG